MGLEYSPYDRLYWTPDVAKTACTRQQGSLFLIGYLFLDIARESFIRDIRLQRTLKFINFDEIISRHSTLTNGTGGLIISLMACSETAVPIRIGSISLYFPDCLFGEDRRG